MLYIGLWEKHICCSLFPTHIDYFLSPSSHTGPRGTLRCDAVRAPHRRSTRTQVDALGYAQCRREDARGLEVSLGSLGQDHLVDSQIRRHLAQTAVLKAKVLEPLHLFHLQPAEMLAPAIQCHLADADLADRIRHAPLSGTTSTRADQSVPNF